MKNIFFVFKKGKVNRTFQGILKQYNNAAKRKDGPHREELMRMYSDFIKSLLTDLRFILPFIVEWREFRRLSSYLDRYAIPNDLREKEKLKKFKDGLEHILGEHFDRQYKKLFAKLSDEELMRLDEALITLKYEAYFSSIVMSVSAVESRLHAIVKRIKLKLYKKAKLSQKPLGRLFEIVSNDSAYKLIREMLPQKFFSLITACNAYRIFSAHPKAEIMNSRDAVSIFGLALSFLLEPI